MPFLEENLVMISSQTNLKKSQVFQKKVSTADKNWWNGEFTAIQFRNTYYCQFSSASFPGTHSLQHTDYKSAIETAAAAALQYGLSSFAEYPILHKPDILV